MSMIGDSRLDSPKRLARRDEGILKNKNIISPDTDQMLSLTYGKTTYYFRTEEKRDLFIKKNKHLKFTGFNFEDNENKMDDVPGMVVEDME